MNKDLHLLQDAYSQVINENVLDDIIIKHDMPEHDDHQCESVDMARTQVLNMLHNIKELMAVLGDCEGVEHLQASKLTIADDYISKVKESLMFSK